MLKRIAIRTFLSLIFFNYLIPFNFYSNAGSVNLRKVEEEKIFLSFNDLEKIILENNLQLKNAIEDINNANYSLKASYSFKELKNFILENNLSSLEVFEDGDKYLIVYGNV